MNIRSERRAFLATVSVSFCGVWKQALAAGHNAYCTYRDSGGAYLAEQRVLVAGSRYRTVVATVPRQETHPITVLVETEAQYAQALADIRRQGVLPPQSIAVFDITDDPAPALRSLDLPLRTIKVVHDLPMNVSHARAIHGKRYSDSHYAAALPSIQELRKRMDIIGATDLSTADPALGVKDQFAQIVNSSESSDLVILVGHRENEIDGYHVRFHDGTSYRISERSASAPIVWVISCTTWDEMVNIAQVGVPSLATGRPLTYAQGVSAAELVVKSKSLRDVAHRIQSTQKLRSTSSEPPQSELAKPSTIRSRQKRNSSHPAAKKPAESYSVIAEIITPRVFSSPGYVEIA